MKRILKNKFQQEVNGIVYNCTVFSTPDNTYFTYVSSTNNSLFVTFVSDIEMGKNSNLLIEQILHEQEHRRHVLASLGLLNSDEDVGKVKNIW